MRREGASRRIEGSGEEVPGMETQVVLNKLGDKVVAVIVPGLNT